MIPHSQANAGASPSHLMSPSTSQDAIYSSSPLSEYSVTVPDLDAPGGARRSTSASDALQYYWSSSAGERSGSVGSNLALSPIDLPSSSHILTSPYSLSSPHSLAPLSTSPMMAHHKSDVSLRDLVAEEQEQGRQRAAAANGASTEYNAPLEDPRRSVPRDHDVSSAGQSNRHIHLVSYPSDGSLQSAAHHRRSSRASSNSGESEYSDCERDDPPEKPIQRRTSPMSQQRPRGLVDAEGRLDVMLDPSFEEWAHQRAWDGGENKSSSAPISPSDAAAPGAASDRWHTPVTTLLERRRATRTPSPQGDRTPRNSAPSGTQTPRASLPKSGRLLFVASPEVSRRSIDALEREARAVDGLGLDTTRGSRLGLSILANEHDSEMPHSAPAIKTGFGDILLPEPRRPTSLLPSVQMRSQARHTLRPPNSDAGLNARRSPEPPPRSELRKQRTRTLTPPQGPIVTTPPSLTSPLNTNNNTDFNRLNTHGGLRTQTLPTIINTPNTPVASPQQPGRSAREPSPRSHTAPLPGDRARSDSTQKTNMRESGTIQDLTKILGGAIDEIGLIDSRDTPPPNIEVPPKQRLPLRLSQVPVRSASSHVNALPVHSPEQQFSQLSPLSPTGQVQGTSPTNGRGNMLSASPVGLGLMSSVGASVAAAGNAATQRTGNAVRHVRKASSILSLRSSNYSYMSPTASTFSGGSLPNAVLFGSIKQLKTPGDRARAYAQSVAELQRTDSGLREWLYPQYPIRPAMPRPAVAAQSGLGLGLRPPDQQQRIVSGSSEFPIRVDAYSARELSVRNLEPADAPTALPSNLPYPTLQQHVKGSNSMQSLTSLSSYKPQPRGLGRAFNFLKREKENASLTSLGPANPQAFAPSMGGSKRELRNMPISGPYSPAAGRSSLDSIEGPRVQPSLAVPRGPREVPGRASHEIQRTSADRQRSPVPGPHGASPLAQRDHNTSDEEVRAMSEMLPHGERAVLRAYLQTYGEPSYALTAYIEDEKNGTLMRAA
ncbi:uncharacterized protein CcaverHIS019_0303810 [Cutaneotrichosporon cavernicola]|uniref:Uncharacterized protein n=1 Tax=Cutaneotrichosporon cavernicola TaxID=279322 RepID=A0AA48I390_9TREE|nr:uncharacterized protein CcaverHIS019_0303810 [Cutaneotrichosporon cavernicola]BEI90311.1 hypothetical protein CcaverHIS019_0303810 [Cutaneotrichosporon cavernicola]BEI98087.1 hypothetical protein CcaverHIS631_0303860 [Cutaneotrichosporon cavernicola]BEJ05864.1 hypothetical protein CcaverHIS641_0303860 [Cutaneotrichosporon cavernicola]